MEQGGVAAAMRRLADDPHPRGSSKLKGTIHRLRVGACRLTYAISDPQSVIVVLKIARPETAPQGALEELLWRSAAILPNDSPADHKEA